MTSHRSVAPRAPGSVVQSHVSSPQRVRAQGVTLAPPAYGMSFVDRGLGAAAEPSREPGSETTRSADRPAGGDSGRALAVAREAMAGPGVALPFREVIQRSFGRHDLGEVAAHLDARGNWGTRQLGAEAFAMGDQVAFASRPDLHTAAHEAAHVIQQRSGISLPGRLSRIGDVHEQNAEAVAERVASGRSSEDLLAPYGPTEAHSPTAVNVQAKIARGKNTGWGALLWADNFAEDRWKRLDQLFNEDLEPLLKDVRERKEFAPDPLGSRYEALIKAIETVRTEWDGRDVPYREAPALIGRLEGLFTENGSLRQAHHEADRALIQSWKDRLGEKITSLKFSTKHAPDSRARKQLVKELEARETDSRLFAAEERGALAKRVKGVEKDYRGAERLSKSEAEQLRLDREEQAARESAEKLETKRLDDETHRLKTLLGDKYPQLAGACGHDVDLLAKLVKDVSSAELGQLQFAMGLMTPTEWLRLRARHGLSVLTLKSLVEAAEKDRVPHLAALLAAIPSDQTSALITLLKHTHGKATAEGGAALISLLTKLDFASVVTLVDQARNDPIQLEPIVAPDEVDAADVKFLLTTPSAADVVQLLESLPDSALLRKLQRLVPDQDELRWFVRDLATSDPARAAVRARLGQKTPAATKDILFALPAVRAARGLTPSALGVLPTRRLTDLLGTGERVGVEATLRHLSGGPRPVLSHPTDAKFGEPFNNDQARLPGVAAAGGYREYYVEKDPASPPAQYHGSRRLVVSNAVPNHVYYTADHYQTFVRLLA